MSRIVTFPGSNCDYDAYQASSKSFGEEASISGTRTTTCKAAT